MTNHDVLRFQVSVNKVFAVHGLQNMNHLGSIKNGLFWRKQADDSDGIKKLHTVDEFGQEVDVILIFIGPYELHYKWRLN